MTGPVPIEQPVEAVIDEAHGDLGAMLVDVLAAVLQEEAELLPDGVESSGGPDAVGDGPDAAALLAVRDERAGADLGVQVRVPPALARLLAVRMFACDEPTSEDLLDAVGELGNIAGGSVKSLLFPGPDAARLSLPSAVLGGPAGPPAARDGAAAAVTLRALVLGDVVELVLVPDVQSAALVWPPVVRTEVLEAQP